MRTGVAEIDTSRAKEPYPMIQPQVALRYQGSRQLVVFADRDAIFGFHIADLEDLRI